MLNCISYKVMKYHALDKTAMYVCKIKNLKPPKNFIQYFYLKTEPFYLKYNNLVSCAHASSYYVCLVIVFGLFLEEFVLGEEIILVCKIV